MELNSKQIKEVIQYHIVNNEKLAKDGKKQTTILIEGSAGIGKTTLTSEIAKEMGYELLKVNPASFSDPSDIGGYPIKEVTVNKGTESLRVPIELIPYYLNNGYSVVENSMKLSYAPPKYILPSGDKPSILLFDDFNRCLPPIQQAIMELINIKQHLSYRLPDNCHVILTANPENDDDHYQVNSSDFATETRYLTYKMKFDIKEWCEWATNNDIDIRLINFYQYYYNELSSIVEPKLNARIITNVFSSLHSIDDFDSNKDLISLIVSPLGNQFTSLLLLFINNKLDKLMTPEDFFTLSMNEITNRFNEYNKNDNGSAIKSLLADRLVSYLRYKKTNKSLKTADINNRLIELMTDTKYFNKDIIIYLFKEITSISNNTYRKLFTSDIKNHIPC
jgi:hypothetical protein